jgi:glycerate 2-kinase
MQGLILAAPDKFRGSLTAAEAARALAAGAGPDCRELPLADGGEGTLDVLGGANRLTGVTGPLGEPVDAEWRLENGTAVIEAARASGLALAGGPAGNDPVKASTFGTGELIAAALAAGARQVVVALGGSATTDGGAGAVEALGGEPFRVPVRVACDVETRFVDAATVFAPQKGATDEQVELLTRRLEELAASYGPVADLPGSGAAGGLAGGLASLGAELVPGFDLVARHAGLEAALEEAELVLTGEGRLDTTSFEGKVVGGVLAACSRRGLPVVVIAGEIEAGLVPAVPAYSLIESFGRQRAFADAAARIAELAAEATGRRARSAP